MLTGLKKDDSVVFQYLVSLSPMIRELSFGPWAHRYPASFVARSSPWLRPGHKDVSEVMWAVFRIWLKGREHVMRFSLCPTRAGWDADLGGESHLEQHGWGQYLGLIEWQLGKNSGCWHHGTIIRRPRLLIPGLLGNRQICFLLKPLLYLFLFKKFILIYLVATSLSCSTWKLLLWHVGSSSLTRDQSQASLHWKHRVLATGPPGKSWNHCFRSVLNQPNFHYAGKRREGGKM